MSLFTTKPIATADDSPRAERHIRWGNALRAVSLLFATVVLLCCLTGPMEPWASGPPSGVWKALTGWLSHPAELLALQAQQPLMFAACFFCVFTCLSALALPGCGPLAVAAGLWFGLALGTALVVLASTVGATLSFMTARHLLRDVVQRRFGHRLHAVEAGLARDGGFYLFSLRVAPLIPYALVNPLMGLSKMPLPQFFSISLVGMLAGSAVYVYAGTSLVAVPLASLGWSTLFSPTLIGALLLLALLPWAVRAVRQLLVPAWQGGST